MVDNAENCEKVHLLFRGFAKFNPSVFGWRGENQKHFGKSYCFEAVSRSFGGRAASRNAHYCTFLQPEKKVFYLNENTPVDPVGYSAGVVLFIKQSIFFF